MSIYLGLALLAVNAVLGATGTEESDSRCGSYCVYIGLRALELGPAHFSALEARLGQPKDTGYSMAQLEDAARSFGAYTMCVRTTPENLLRRQKGFVCIALMERKHFILIYNLDEGAAYIADPPRSFKIPVDTLRTMWQGNALLLSRAPFVPEESLQQRRSLIARLFPATGALCTSAVALLIMVRLARFGNKRSVGAILLLCAFASPGCGTRVAALDRTSILEVSPDRHDLGDIYAPRADQTREVITLLKNKGTEELHIRGIRISCTCSSAKLSQHAIPPGSFAELHTRIRVGNHPGAAVSIVTMQTTDTANPVKEVRIKWTIIHPLRLEPSVSDLGVFDVNEEATRECVLLGSDFGLCPSCLLTLKSDSPRLSATFERDNGMEVADHSEHGKKMRDRALGRVILGINASDVALFYRAILTINVVCQGHQRATLDVPVGLNVSPVVAITPSAVFLGLCNPSDAFKKKVIVTSHDGTAFRVRGCRCADGTEMARVSFDTSAASFHELLVQGKVPATEGTWMREIHIKTDHPKAGDLLLRITGQVVRELARQKHDK